MVDSDEDPNFLPNPIGPLAVSNGVWFKDEPSIKPTFVCEDEIINPVANPDTLEDLLRTALTFDLFNDEVTWMMKMDIFEMMLLDPSLHSNTVLDSFFSVEEANSLGKLVTWQTELSSRFGVESIDKQEVQDLMYFLSDEIEFEDSILAIVPHVGAFSYWLSRREATTDSLNDAITDWILLLDEEYTDSRSAYSDIENDLENLTTANDLEEYIRQALLFKTEYLLGNSFSSGDSTDLLELGQVCPFLAGRAIQVAHELYSTIADSTMVPSVENCESPSPFVFRPSNIRFDAGATISVFPNPVIDKIEVNSEFSIEKLELTNLTMEPMVTYYPGNNKYDFSMKNFPAGTYLLTTTTKHGITILPIILLK